MDVFCTLFRKLSAMQSNASRTGGGGLKWGEKYSRFVINIGDVPVLEILETGLEKYAKFNFNLVSLKIGMLSHFHLSLNNTIQLYVVS